MPFDPRGYWYPELSAKQLEIFNCTKRYILASGPRMSGKTIGNLHRVVRHGVETHRARIGMFAKTLKNATCVSGDTMVQTSRGLVRIAELTPERPGQSSPMCDVHVLSYDAAGNALSMRDATVSHRITQTSGIRLTLAGGYQITGSTKHPVWCHSDFGFAYLTTESIRTLISSGSEVWVPLVVGGYQGGEPVSVDINNGNGRQRESTGNYRAIRDYVSRSGDACINSIARATRCSTSTVARYLKDPHTCLGRGECRQVDITEGLAWILGLLAGDGTITSKSFTKKSPRLTCFDKDLIEIVKIVCKEEIPDCTVRQHGAGDWSISSATLKKLIVAIGMVGNAHTKRIPSVILKSPRNVLCAFLSGLFDADGTAGVNDGYVAFTTISEGLAKDVHVCLLALGIESRRARSTPPPSKFARSDSWRIELNSQSIKFYDQVGFRLKRKQDRRSTLRSDADWTSLKYPDGIRKELMQLYRSRLQNGYNPTGGAANKHAAMYGRGLCTPHGRSLALFCDTYASGSSETLDRFRIGDSVTWRKVALATVVDGVDLHDLTVPETGSFVGNCIINHNSGGVWNDMLEIILPEWFDSGTGVRYTTKRPDGTYGPKQTAQSRMLYFKISNQHGSESEFQLHSIDNENEAEAIIKGTRFSCFYFTELSNFRSRAIFDAATVQLRMPHLAFEDHLWISDTNPPDDGEDSWMHDIWFKLLDKMNKAKHEEFMASQLALIHVMIEDNPYLTEAQIADLHSKYAYDPDLYARYIRGQWVKASRDAIYSRHFRPEIHTIGNCSSLDEANWQILLPSEHCTEMITGWDLGDVFCSAHILEPIHMEGVNGRAYQVIDEICHLDRNDPVRLSDFTEGVVERMDYWEKVTGKTLLWRHYSDAAALTNYRSGAETYDKNLVFKYSDSRILLEAAPKFRDSINKRIGLLKILLHENRLFVSAQLSSTIAMFKTVKRGRGTKKIADSIYRHVFDSLTYALASEEPGLLFTELSDAEDDEPRMVSVG